MTIERLVGLFFFIGSILILVITFFPKTNTFIADDYLTEDKNSSSNRLLHLKIRRDSFLWVINRKMPWEDLLIGFQCRVDRVPDIYNTDFWFHFTNQHVGQDTLIQ